MQDFLKAKIVFAILQFVQKIKSSFRIILSLFSFLILKSHSCETSIAYDRMERIDEYRRMFEISPFNIFRLKQPQVKTTRIKLYGHFNSTLLYITLPCITLLQFQNPDIHSFPLGPSYEEPYSRSSTPLFKIILICMLCLKA